MTRFCTFAGTGYFYTRKCKEIPSPKTVRIFRVYEGSFFVRLSTLNARLWGVFENHLEALAAAKTAAYCCQLSYCLDYDGQMRDVWDQYIYFVIANGIPRIKIGKTTSLKDRLITLQTGCPIDLNMVGYVAGANGKEESKWHEVFDYLRYKNEWFHLNEELANTAYALGDWAKDVCRFVKKVNS